MIPVTEQVTIKIIDNCHMIPVTEQVTETVEEYESIDEEEPAPKPTSNKTTQVKCLSYFLCK